MSHLRENVIVFIRTNKVEITGVIDIKQEIHDTMSTQMLGIEIRSLHAFKCL